MKLYLYLTAIKNVYYNQGIFVCIQVRFHLYGELMLSAGNGYWYFNKNFQLCRDDKHVFSFWKIYDADVYYCLTSLRPSVHT